jgi:hypothetical protein
MHRGYIKVWRRVGDNPLWTGEKFTRGQAWIDLIILANHKDGHIRKRGIKIVVKRGEMAWSERELANRWMWSRGKVRRFIDELCSGDDPLLIPQTGPQKKNAIYLYKIVNYDEYQGNSTTERTTNGPQTDHKRYQNKNEKNEKNEIIKKEIIKKKKPAPKKKPEKPAPESFPITDQMIKYASDKGYLADLEDLTEGFLVHHRAKGTLFSDWYAAWQKWLRNQLAWYPEKNVPPGCNPVQSKQLKPTTYAQAQDLERRQQAAALLRYEDECNQKNDQRGACQDQPRIERKAVN